MNLQQLVRKNVWNMKAYSSARDEFKGEASVFLDANENPLNDKYNRYPDPLQWKLKEKIAKIKDIEPEKIFLGNGSDEPIDLVIRIFCEPRTDNIVAIDPTYGMYQVCADVNDVEYRKILLNENFDLDAQTLLEKIDNNTKIIFLCSPNNPTGNLLNRKEIEKILNSFAGIVIVDEAYIDFASEATWLGDLDKYPNLIVLQTFSKAWGLAAVRLGMAFASPDIIKLFNKVKYPYNVNILTQNFVSEELDKLELRKEWVSILLKGRDYLKTELPKLSFVEKIYPTDANFLLVKVADANGLYKQLADKGVIVRNRNSVSLCAGCLRITVGTDGENKTLIETLKQL
ncbi:histidinol-phosphate aminotransferase [Dysgonomonas sp. PFB1-18]|uniref:histidinol-phosphate transaminase n=1 Tax=unclassified Dysgonomonas TaxID=2630389 RepID=UPI0024732DF3|nr:MULTISPECIES: histidinol-phosphate transaminase [unclassified Dysgonomonas]MDH6307861.1 histidinol-phosphate aminotransferase [Dysgonomonas sp. PF1-14]MDH6337779.1 histidinol-phosphate aminotransferase [Dysgonomonas sp. PF1-16]MDH6379003.1 histidinol-phosphate aminotransferase [Dysgonomonas sp. PFB1-18]MDH6396638.1 histidinol-phosphate aminotransferase [Dysgonomonas sp. PF1-23]